jgi:hypothetical protein
MPSTSQSNCWTRSRLRRTLSSWYRCPISRAGERNCRSSVPNCFNRAGLATRPQSWLTRPGTAGWGRSTNTSPAIATRVNIAIEHAIRLQRVDRARVLAKRTVGTAHECDMPQIPTPVQQVSVLDRKLAPRMIHPLLPDRLLRLLDAPASRRKPEEQRRASDRQHQQSPERKTHPDWKSRLDHVWLHGDAKCRPVRRRPISGRGCTSAIRPLLSRYTRHRRKRNPCARREEVDPTKMTAPHGTDDRWITWRPGNDMFGMSWASRCEPKS